jgi:putative transposase
MNIGVAMRDHYKGYRMPKSVIDFAVRYYHRYKLSLRDVSELLHDRGIDVTYETIRNWNKTWGGSVAFEESCRRKAQDE